MGCFAKGDEGSNPINDLSVQQPLSLAAFC